MNKPGRFQTFAEFYPFYLSEHANLTNRRLHFLGTSTVLAIALIATAKRRPKLFLALPIAGYGFAWLGHFFFERNKPATFDYPIYSLIGDAVMFWQILTRKIDV